MHELARVNLGKVCSQGGYWRQCCYFTHKRVTISKTQENALSTVLLITHGWQWKFSSIALKNLPRLYVMIIVIQNTNPSNIQQHIMQGHILSNMAGWGWGGRISTFGVCLTHFELEQQIVPVKGQKLQPKGHLLSFPPANPTAKGDVMEQPKQLGYTPLSKGQNEGWQIFEAKCRRTQSLHHCIFFK